MAPAQKGSTMLRLIGLFYSLIASTLAGLCVVVALVAGYTTLIPLLIAALLGAILALPVTYLVAKGLNG